MNAPSRALVALSFALVMFGAPGCSSSAEPEADVDEGALGMADTSETSGAFSVRLDGHTVKFDYRLAWNLSAQTVVWNAKVVDEGGNTQVTNDTDERGTIDAVARCRCTFRAAVAGPSGKLAVVSVADGKITGLKYEGVDAQLIAAGASPTGNASAGASSDVGACKLNGGSCKEIRRDECKAGPLYATQRGRMEFTFEADQRCE